MMKSNFRGLLYALKNRLLGGGLISLQACIREQIESNSNQNQQIREILEYASTHCEAYKGLPPEDLSTWPVMNKLRMMEDGVLSHEFKREKLHRMMTSGSTGVPFECFQNSRKRKQLLAENLVMSGMVGYQVGNPLIYARIWGRMNKRPWWVHWAQNVFPLDISMQNHSTMEKLIRQANATHSSLLGYASFYDAFVQYLRDHDLYTNPFQSAISISETLGPSTQEEFRKRTGTHLYARYSNMENGIIAQQIPGSGHAYVINTASYFIEILDFEKDEPVSMGQKGRIILTDLYNRAMPFIRYDTGDVGAIQYWERSNQLVFTQIEGRRIDQIFNSSGEMISPHTITIMMWEFPQIKQYQLIQESYTDFTIKLNADPTQLNINLFLQTLKEIIGKETNVSYEWVNEIPFLASGKRKKFVNNMRN